MGQRHILDTNIGLYFLNQTLNDTAKTFVGNLLNNNLAALSVITEIEMLGFNFPSAQEELITQEFVADLTILPLTSTVVKQAIAIRKKHKIKLPDAIIAATALANNCVLVSRNISDFNFIDDLVVVNPF